VIANSSHHLAIDYDRHHPGIVIAITLEPVIGMPGTLIGIVRNPSGRHLKQFHYQKSLVSFS
jgi:hypothetical protein